MKQEKRTERRIAFVVDRKQLEALDRIMSGANTPIGYEVEFTDGTTCDCLGLKELLEAMDGPNRSAKKLTAQTPYGREPRVRVDLDAREWVSDSARFTVSGEAAGVAAVSQELREWFSEIRQNYTQWTHVPGVWGVILAPSAVASAFLVAAAQKYLGTEYAKLAVLSVFPLAWWLFVIVRWLFPVGLFAVGAGEGRERRLVDRRRLILVVVVLSGIVLPILRKFLL